MWHSDCSQSYTRKGGKVRSIKEECVLRLALTPPVLFLWCCDFDLAKVQSAWTGFSNPIAPRHLDDAHDRSQTCQCRTAMPNVSSLPPETLRSVKPHILPMKLQFGSDTCACSFWRRKNQTKLCNMPRSSHFTLLDETWKPLRKTLSSPHHGGKWVTTNCQSTLRSTESFSFASSHPGTRDIPQKFVAPLHFEVMQAPKPCWRSQRFPNHFEQSKTEYGPECPHPAPSSGNLCVYM